MTDREKVIKGLEVCLAADLTEDENPCAPCPYFFDGVCQNTMKSDALALLREEAVYPSELRMSKHGFRQWAVCGCCFGKIGVKDDYCKWCGKKVKRNA